MEKFSLNIPPAEGAESHGFAKASILFAMIWVEISSDVRDGVITAQEAIDKYDRILTPTIVEAIKLDMAGVIDLNELDEIVGE